MTDNDSAKSGEGSIFDRRESDNASSLPRSNTVKLAIVCSFLFSIGLVAWAFTLPFRSGDLPSGLAGAANLDGVPQAELASMEYEARLSPQEYVQYTRDLDRRLLNRVADKYDQERPQWDAKQKIRKQWKKSVARRVEQLKVMRKENGGKAFTKGTIEWQNQQELEKIINDAPPEV